MEKLIDLTKTSSYLINLDTESDRLRKSTKILQELDISFERFPAIKHDQGIVGCGLSHLTLLQKIAPESLVLEDDICVTEATVKRLRVPQGADAIYLGVSDHGYIRNQPIGFRGTVLATQYSPEYKRVFNMCGTHAILYLSQRYINAASNIIKHYMQYGLPFDLGLASIHHKFLILATNNPIFYQEGQPEFTNFELEV